MKGYASGNRFDRKMLVIHSPLAHFLGKNSTSLIVGIHKLLSHRDILELQKIDLPRMENVYESHDIDTVTERRVFHIVLFARASAPHS